MAEIDLSSLRAKAEAADAAATAEWECDRERQTDAPYKHHEFFAIDGNGNRMFGTENADAGFGLIETEDDGDGFVAAWNENSRRVIEFTVAAQPRIILALIERVEKAEAMNTTWEGEDRKLEAMYSQLEQDLQDARDEVVRLGSGYEITRLRALLARAGEALTKPREEPGCRMLFDDIRDALARRV